MKNLKLFLLILLLFPVGRVFPKQISSDKAKIIAQKVLVQNNTRSSQSLSLVYTAKEKGNKRSENPNNYYYVFNANGNNGFVIVSADDINVPVIGYSETGEYDADNLPPSFKDWMLSVENGMKKAISENSSPSASTQRKWNKYLSGETDNTIRTTPISPLLKTKWNQTKPFYNMTPVFNSTRTYTGCVATTMAQIMKFHEHPQNIKGTITLPAYTSVKWRERINSIEISNSVFDWDNMIDEYNYYSETPPNKNQEDAVAKLMYYCGVSVEMDYDIIGSVGGSGASSFDAAKSFFTYWGYDKDLNYLNRGRGNSLYYSDKEWKELIKADLNEGRPVYYSGSSERGGHAFICDGVDNTGQFHFNWGWGGYQDGYYDINAPLDYTQGHAIIVNIKPDRGGSGIPIYKVSNFSNFPEIVSKEEAFRFDCSVSDYGMHNIRTTYHIALYDEADNFVEKINFLDYTTEYNSSEAKCKVPESVPAGNYKVKAVLLGENGTYLPIALRPDESFPILTVSDEVVQHSLKLLSNTTFTASALSGEADDYFTATLSFTAKGILFSGDWGIALVDKDDLSIKYIVSESKNEKLGAGSYYPAYMFLCKLPENILPGEYKLMMYAKATDKECAIVRGDSDTVIESVDFRVLGGTVSIEKNEAVQMRFYPNPIKDILIIDTSETIEQVQCYDINGKLLLEKTVVKTLDFGNIPDGVYFLKIKTASGLSTHKVIKK